MWGDEASNYESSLGMCALVSRQVAKEEEGGHEGGDTCLLGISKIPEEPKEAKSSLIKNKPSGGGSGGEDLSKSNKSRTWAITLTFLDGSIFVIF